MTRFLTVLALTGLGLALTAGDAAAFGGRKKSCDVPCPPPCPVPVLAACPVPCPPPVVVCAPLPPPCPPPVVVCAPPCPPPCAAPCPEPCGKAKRKGLFARLCNRGGC